MEHVHFAELWLPILLSALGVFFLSSLVHIVLPWHHKDYDRLPDEDAFLDALRQGKVGPGNYVFPCALTVEERKQPEVIEKMTKGPIGTLTVRPGFEMGKSMGAWLVLCFVISAFVAHLASLCMHAGSDSHLVFHNTALMALLGFSGSTASESIWMGRRWSTTFRHLLDGLLYALTTGAIFAWLWP